MCIFLGKVDENALDEDEENEIEDDDDEDEESEMPVSGPVMTEKMVLSGLRYQQVNIKLQSIILCNRDVG